MQNISNIVKNERFFKSFTLQVCVCAASTNLECEKSSAEMRKNMKKVIFEDPCGSKESVTDIKLLKNY